LGRHGSCSSRNAFCGQPEPFEKLFARAMLDELIRDTQPYDFDVLQSLVSEQLEN
jgi:hypothetical protein